MKNKHTLSTIANLALFLLIIVPHSGFSQTLKGTIVNLLNQPVSDVNIISLSSNQHTHSNALGKFELKEVKTGDLIEISHVGYATKTITVSEDFIGEDLKINLEVAPVSLDQVSVSADVKSFKEIAAIDLSNKPVKNSQEILRRVPGLIIGQHAGGGKAEQIFLRGFDIDHGTDVNIQVDGMPVNMVSHAHGQGYADLHFLIPETIESIDFGKGPYYTDQGNFTTAGYVQFNTKERLNHSLISQEVGRFNTLRTLAMLEIDGDNEKNSAYLAGEFLQSDGFFESSQNFKRVNFLGKYTTSISDQQKISVQASHFQSRWDASGQIPERAVNDGSITRFGAIDDTEGGQTSRTNVGLTHYRFIDNNTFVKSSAYYSKYGFELFSNFTFFLEDPINGDQIKQKETRDIIGLNSTFHKNWSISGSSLHTKAGIGLRYDNIDENELSRTANRQELLQRLAYGNIDESNLYGFADAEWSSGKWLLNAGLRADYFNFSYINLMDSLYNPQSQERTFISPKLNILYTHDPSLQFYLKSGIGFHSNDTRVIIENNAEEVLPAAYGSDLGLIWLPSNKIMINTALWYLFLEQEFVYVGDAGIVEPSGETQRMGIDLSLRIQPVKNIFIDADVNYAIPRAVTSGESAEKYIPLAPTFTSTGGIMVQASSVIKAALNYRYLADRPANEDNSLTAEGYFVMDANISFDYPHFRFFVQFENILNTDWKETQFETESQLRGEAEPVSEIHFTPGTPFSYRVGFQYAF